MKFVTSLIGICLLIFFVTGCHKKSRSIEPISQPSSGSTENQPQEPNVLEGDPLSQTEIEEITKRFQAVFFDFNKSEIREDQVWALRNNAHVLQEYPNIYVVLEGHCDERGTDEYNLALGEQRANAVKSYLTFLGVDPQRIRPISYGESKPFAFGHSERAWQQNRRGHPVAIQPISGSSSE